MSLLRTHFLSEMVSEPSPLFCSPHLSFLSLNKEQRLGAKGEAIRVRKQADAGLLSRGGREDVKNNQSASWYAEIGMIKTPLLQYGASSPWNHDYETQLNAAGGTSPQHWDSDGEGRRQLASRRLWKRCRASPNLEANNNRQPQHHMNNWCWAVAVFHRGGMPLGIPSPSNDCHLHITLT